METRTRLTTKIIILIYMLIGGLWFFFSNKIVQAFSQNPAMTMRIQTGMQFFFFVVSALALYLLFVRWQKENREKSEIYKKLFDNCCNAMFLLNEMGYMDCNKAALEMLGLSNKQERIEQFIHDLILPPQSDNSVPLPALNQYLTEI